MLRFIYESMGKFASRNGDVATCSNVVNFDVCIPTMFRNINVLINEPNLKNPKMNINLYSIKDCGNLHNMQHEKTKPFQTQTNGLKKTQIYIYWTPLLTAIKGLRHMNRTIFILLTLLTLFITGCATQNTDNTIIPDIPGYELVWSDEFNGNQINTENWSHEVGDQWHNQEQQAYTDSPKNSYVKNGSLVIAARKESYHGKHFTSARMRTKGKQDFLYGRFEASIKLPFGHGMWPAFWMMGTDDHYGTWAASGEIDILEAKNTPMEIRGNLHFGGQWPDNAKVGSTAYADGSDFSKDYHTYAIEWEPREIRWYCDGKLYKATSSWWTGSKKNNGTFPAPFDKKFHFLINLAVGGSYMECYEPECVTAPMPQKMYIDYVRVYQKN